MQSINDTPPEGIDRSDYKYSEEGDKAKIEQDNDAIAKRLRERLAKQKSSSRYQELWNKRKVLPVYQEKANILQRIRNNQVYKSLQS